MFGRTRQRRLVVAVMAFAVVAGAAAHGETPLVVFDVPFTVECRDVTPKGFAKTYKRKVLEAVFKVSPQLLAGEEKDLRRLHYEISSEQQMPIVGFLPSSQVASDVADGTIAIRTSDHHGQLLARYFITPAAGEGKLTGDLTSSNAQYTLLAPRQLLLAAGTIQRGCGVYFDLRPSTQDTLQKQREYACLFDVPAAWRADYVAVSCKANGVKHGFVGESAVNCGLGMLSVGLYQQGDAEARELADQLAKKQQMYLDRLTQDARTRLAKSEKSGWLTDLVGALDRALFSRTVMKAKQAKAGVGFALQGQVMEDRGFQGDLSSGSRNADDEVAAAKRAIRKLNGRE